LDNDIENKRQLELSNKKIRLNLDAEAEKRKIDKMLLDIERIKRWR